MSKQYTCHLRHTKCFWAKEKRLLMSEEEKAGLWELKPGSKPTNWQERAALRQQVTQLLLVDRYFVTLVTDLYVWVGDSKNWNWPRVKGRALTGSLTRPAQYPWHHPDRVPHFTTNTKSKQMWRYLFFLYAFQIQETSSDLLHVVENLALLCWGVPGMQFDPPKFDLLVPRAAAVLPELVGCLWVNAWLTHVSTNKR